VYVLLYQEGRAKYSRPAKEAEIAGQRKSFGRKATVHVIVSLSENAPENSA